MNLLTLPSPVELAIVVAISGVLFTVLWYFDHRTHLAIWQRDITDGELRTHRLILYASYALQASLVLMAWSPWIALPLFLGAWITRTVHEAIDEFHWHLPRCTEREALIHLGMWITIHAGTTAMFIWGFFYRFEGILGLPKPILVVFGAVFVAMGAIGRSELFEYTDRKPQPQELRS
jgi:hypothetical protein